MGWPPGTPSHWSEGTSSTGTDYQQLFDEETKRIMEFPADWQPCFLPGGPNTCPTNPFAQDGMSKLKRMYAEAGGRPDNIRRGWLRRFL
jgi:hypothetical protein